MHAVLTPVLREQLDRLVAAAPAPPAFARPQAPGVNGFDLETWLTTHAPEAQGPRPWQGGRRWILVPCPWNPDHSDRSAYVVQFASGAIAAGCQHDGCAGRDWHALRDAREPGWRDHRGSAGRRPSGVSGAAAPREDDGLQEDQERRKKSQADRLVELAGAAELFHDPAGDTYARARLGRGFACWPTRSRAFRRWLVRAYYEEHGKAPGAQALADALGVIEARALFDGDCCPVYLRIAPDGRGGTFLDLADETGRTVHVTSGSWQVVDGADVRFRRSPGMRPLPEPARGGRLDELRSFVNVPDDAAWALVKAWLRACLRDRGSYPVLALYGEQGSAKTTLARMLRALADPALPELRSDPRELRDLSIAARASWLVACDNVSSIQPWLSDGLCRMATGGGWATRELYTDFDEVLFEARRPVLLNGITEYIVRGDLLDRALQVTLPSIPEETRRDEESLWAAFEVARPRLLGALLDDVAAGLAMLPRVRLDRLPRMADFSRFAVAVERGREESPRFLQAYADARGQTHEQALESSAIGPVLLLWIDDLPADGAWRGTAAELLAGLTALADDAAKRRGWPTSARALSGELRRLAPALRGIGVAVKLGVRGAKGRRLITLERAGAGPSPSSPPPPSRADGVLLGDGGDGRDGVAACVSGRRMGGPDPGDWGEL